jgi:hypothetical protein
MIDIVLGLWTFGWIVTCVMMLMCVLEPKNPFFNSFVDGVVGLVLAVMIWPVLIVDAIVFIVETNVEELKTNAQ